MREFEPEQSRHFDDPQALIDVVLQPEGPWPVSPVPDRPVMAAQDPGSASK